MTKSNTKELKTRIDHLIENSKNANDFEEWHNGYSTACEHILKMIEEIEKRKIIKSRA